MRGFSVGQRVSRDVDVFHPERGSRAGVIVSRYGKWGGLDGVRWYDPEVYDVRFDDGRTERGFFRHGLQPETAAKESR